MPGGVPGQAEPIKEEGTLNKLANALTALTGSKDQVQEVDEVIGITPIDVVNYKDIEFVKVDANDKTKKLQGATFEIHYKDKEDGKYAALTKKVTEKGKEVDKPITVTSGTDGKFKLPISKPGYYALVETKAPDEYSKMPGYIKEFKLENGKIKVLEKDPIKASYTEGAKGLISSQVLSVAKDKKTFTQRIVINPNHEVMTIPSNSSYLRILENNWSVTPKAEDGLGGEVKVALLKKDPGEKDKNSIEELTKDDFTPKGAVSYDTIGNNRGSRYSLLELLGKDNVTPTATKPVTTTDTIVVEYTGKIEDEFMGEKTTYPIKQKAEVILDVKVVDEANYDLDPKFLTSDNESYVDRKVPIYVENTKTKYPLTGGIGALIFAIIGAGLMTAAYIGYKRKKVIE